MDNGLGLLLMLDTNGDPDEAEDDSLVLLNPHFRILIPLWTPSFFLLWRLDFGVVTLSVLLLSLVICITSTESYLDEFFFSCQAADTPDP